MQREILEQNPEADVQVYAIWFDMVAGDSRDRTPVEVLSDRRVEHFWDRGRAVGRFYGADRRHRSRSVIDREVLWDAYFLYGPGSSWDDEPSHLLGQGSTILDHAERLRRSLFALWQGDSSSPSAVGLEDRDSYLDHSYDDRDHARSSCRAAPARASYRRLGCDHQRRRHSIYRSCHHHH